MTSSLIDRLNAVSEQVALKRPVRIASTANLALSGFQAIDGVTPAASDANLRVLVKNQAAPAENGIYLMATGAWQRTDDFDGNRDVVKGTRVPVTEGSIGANKTYVVTSDDPIVIDTTGITFSEITESLVTSEFAKPRAAARTAAEPAILLTVADAGTLINVDCSGVDKVGTLPPGSTLTNGDQVGIRYAAGTNQITIACQGNDAINGKTSFALGARYECLWLEWDGSAYNVVGHAQPFSTGNIVFIKVVSRTLTTPPVSPEPGARYIIAANGTLNGDWSSYANNDVVESNGQGGWIRYTPSESWHAYVEAENKLVFYTGSAWQALPNTDNPGSSNLTTMLLQNVQTAGVGGGTPIGLAWTRRNLNTERVNTITGASLNGSGQVVLPTGRYRFLASQVFLQTNVTRTRIISTTDATKKVTSTQTQVVSANGDRGISTVFGELEVTGATETFELQYFVSNTPANGLGEALGTEEEIYATLMIEAVAALQGPQGAPGEQGPQGFAGFKYRYSGSTIVPADPGLGHIRFNTLTFGAGMTAASIDPQSIETGNPSILAEILRWDDTGIMKMTKVGAGQNWATFDVTNVVDNSGNWLDLTLVYRAHAGTFTDTNDVSIQFIPKGGQGIAGTTIPIYSYLFKTATGGDPTSGGLLFNNATLSSANSFSIHDNDALSPAIDRSVEIGYWDDDGASANRGTLYVINVATGARILRAKVTGSLADGGAYPSYQSFMITDVVTGATPANNTPVAVMFIPAGATGSVGGSTGGTDNAVLRADGPGGTTLQTSKMTIDDDGKANVNLETALANTVGTAAKFSRTTSGIPEAGIGVAIELETQAAGGNVVGGRIESVATTVAASSEDFDIVFKTRSDGALVERMRLKDGGNLELGSSDAFALKASGGQALTGGFTVGTPFNLGTVSSGSITPSGANGQLQYLTNGGAFQINPPAADTAIDMLVTNNASAGTITFSSTFKIGASAGDALTLANGSIAMVSIQRINGVSTYSTRLLTTF